MHCGLLILAPNAMSTEQDHIREYLLHKSGSIFSHPVFIERLHAGNAGYAKAVDRGGNIQAVLPFVKYVNTGFKRLSMPLFAQYTPLSITYPEGILEGKKFSFELQVMEQLIEQLPKADHYLFHLPFKHENILPFLWVGFESTVRYSFTFQKGIKLEYTLGAMRPSLRRKLKKLSQEFTVETSTDVAKLIELTDKNYRFKDEHNPFTSEQYLNLFEAGEALKCGKLWIAKNSSGAVVGAHFYLRDKEYVHYLVGASEPEFRHLGLSTLLIWKGIEWAAELNLGFNFEGSMTPSIAKYFSGFGAQLTPYYRVEKYRSKMAKLLRENLGKKKELTTRQAPSNKDNK